MHIQLRHDICYDFKTDVKSFVAHFIKLLGHASDALQLTPQVLHKMKDLIKLHNLNKFLKDSKFGSNFIDLQKIAKQWFWTYFGYFFVEFV